MISNAGPPQAVSNLTTMVTQPSDNDLILSWSAPSSPVQLHYTVTVWTNTSTITMFNTSSTTITISRDNITTSDSTSECDQYVWSVTAINPAGTSTPTNITATIPSGLPVPSPLWDNLLLYYYKPSSSRWNTKSIVYKQVICTANNVTKGNNYYFQSPVFNTSFVCSIMFCSTHTGSSVFDR